ncbi:hypothetical protein FRC16_010038 [Serendipita sp. 398]|nr:hypothetical protein FRC16_010038 [Serendipita sp. 398]
MGEELSKKNKEIIHLIVDAFFQVWVVDIFHFLRFIPSWFPGATFKRVGARGTALSNYVRYKPFEAVQKLYNSGNLGHSIVKDLLDEFGPDDDARDALAVLDTAGSDTTTAAICAFLHTMYLFPEIASKVSRVERVFEVEPLHSYGCTTCEQPGRSAQWIPDPQRPDPTTVTYTDLNFRLPINFHSRFVPRDEKAENLLKSMALSE